MSGKVIRKLPTSSFHVYFKVGSPLKELVEEASDEISRKYGSKFTVNEFTYIPHITLYLFAAPIGNTRKMQYILETIFNRIKKPDMQVSRLALGRGNLISLVFDNPGLFTGYHKNIIKNINPLRSGTLRKKYRILKKIDSLPGKERIMLLKYGDKHAFSTYVPHISLTQPYEEKIIPDIIDKYGNLFAGQRVKIESIRFVKIIGNESGGMGKTLLEKKFS